MKILSLLAALALGVLVPAVAAADPSSADRATARALGLEGEAALASKDYPTAADRYARAEGLFHAPTLLLGLARAEVGLGKLVDAQETYRRIVHEELPPNAPPIFAEAVAVAEKELAAVVPRIAWLTITVNGPASAAVRLDGAVLPPAALGARRALDPGTHEVVAVAEGYLARKTSVTLADGKAEAIVLDLVAAPPPATPVSPTITFAAVAPVQPADGRSTQRVAGAVLLGAGGAGLLVGAVAGALVIAQHGSLAPVCPQGHCPVSEQGYVDAYHAKGWVSTGGFVGGAVVAATGLVVLLTAPKRASALGAVMPYGGLGSVGAVGRFW
jgi:hypothetical protein